MYLRSLEFERYRAFAGSEMVEIKPLTIVIGKNSSGKSALVRLPLLLEKALSGKADGPIDLDLDGVDLGSSFEDLIHARSRRPMHLGATFGTEGRSDTFSFSAELLYVTETRSVLVLEYRVTFQGTERVCVYSGSQPPPPRGPWRYDVTTTGADDHREMDLTFSGLWPQIVSPQGGLVRLVGDESLTTELQRAIRPRYLGPFRQVPARRYDIPGGSPRTVGTHGRSAPAVLAADKIRFGGTLVGQVADWYQKHLGGWPLDVVMNSDSFSVVVRTRDHAYPVNLVDAGAGLSQVLPIVVQRFFDQSEWAEGVIPWLEIVEQPELHLHPAAHGAIADLYLDAIAQPGTFVMLETHSENLVLRIRRRIAEGTIDPGRVALYFVDDTGGSGSTIRSVPIRPDGSVDGWPATIFSEDFEEVRAIRRARGASQDVDP